MPRLESEWGIRSLPVTWNMLVAQAQCESLTVVTGDPAITVYDIRTIDARM